MTIEEKPQCFYVTIAEMEKRINQTRKQQELSIKKLKELGLIETYICPKCSFRYFHIVRKNLVCYMATDENRDKVIEAESLTPPCAEQTKGGACFGRTYKDKEPISKNPREDRDNVSAHARKTDIGGIPIHKRYRLSQAQCDTLEWLKTKSIDTPIQTLAYWAKTYTLERLQAVFTESVRRKATSVGAYMNKLLKSAKDLFAGTSSKVTESFRANMELAKDFLLHNPWLNGEVLSDCVKIVMGRDYAEIPFHLDSRSFCDHLLEKSRSARACKGGA